MRSLELKPSGILAKTGGNDVCEGTKEWCYVADSGDYAGQATYLY